MKRDIRINYSLIYEIASQVNQYKAAIEIMESSLNSIKVVIETENKGEAINALIDRYESLQKKINSCKEELEDLHNLFGGYYNDMKALIKPIKESDLVQVDGDDIWWNLRDIKKAINKIDNLKKESSTINVYTESHITPYTDMKVQYQWGGSSGTSTHSEADEQNQQENVRKIDEIKDIIGQCTRSMRDQIEFMEDDFNKYIAPFRNLDDDYASRTNPIYNKYSSNKEMRQNERDYEIEQSKRLVEGAWNNIKGLGDFIGGAFNYGVGGFSLAISQLKGTELSEEDKAYINSFIQGNEIIKELIKDPYLIVEGIAQQTSDDLDQKGLSYVAGGAIADYFLFKIGKGIKVKVGNVSKLENVLEKVSGLINKLKTKFDDIFDIVEETVDKGDSIIFKLGDGSETTITKAELKAQGISDSAIQYCIDGCFVGDTLVLTDKGFRRIDEIEVGDFVYSTDVKTGDKKYKEVLQVHKRNTYEFVKLNIEGEEIRTTPRHLFYTYEGRWIIAGELKPGDEILSSDGQAKKVISVKEELLEETERIYNLCIEGYSTYYVSKLALLVHNMGCVKLADLLKSASEKSGKFSTLELKQLRLNLKNNVNYSNVMFRELMTSISADKIILDKVTYNGQNAIKIVEKGTSTSLIIDSQGKVLEMKWTVGKKVVEREEVSGYLRAPVPAGTEKGHLKSIFEGAKDNCIDDSPLNIIPQTKLVNSPKISGFEAYRVNQCQGLEVINENLANGYVRVRIPRKNIDVTYNPLSTNTKRWPKDWYLQFGETFD